MQHTDQISISYIIKTCAPNEMIHNVASSLNENILDENKFGLEYFVNKEQQALCYEQLASMSPINKMRTESRIYNARKRLSMSLVTFQRKTK